MKKINQKLLTIANNDKINYGGDLEINWVPEIFKGTDLFNLGHLGIDDTGTFATRTTENYNDYLTFMKESYNFDRNKSVNAFSGK